MSDVLKQVISELTDVNNKLSDAIEDGPEGSFKTCLHAIEEAAAIQNERIWKAIELLKEIETPEPTIRAIISIDYEDFGEETLEAQIEHQLEEFKKYTKVSELEVFFAFEAPQETVEKIRAMLRITAGLDSPMNRNLNMIIDGDRLFSEVLWKYITTKEVIKSDGN